ncbi:MAG: hypothetical protein FD131_555, partial [Rhodocyclaceae bacterium]
PRGGVAAAGGGAPRFGAPAIEPEQPVPPPVFEGLQLGGPAEAVAGAEVDISVVAPGQTSALMVDVAYDPMRLEVIQPAAVAPGRITLRMEQGSGNLRLRVLPGAKGETRVDVTGATLESGEPYSGAAVSHAIKLN